MAGPWSVQKRPWAVGALPIQVSGVSMPAARNAVSWAGLVQAAARAGSLTQVTSGSAARIPDRPRRASRSAKSRSGPAGVALAQMVVGRRQ
ncbi:hypothetical protein [Embleya scabrispora]|nr:hypothetical protein [Embleya scabrispora]